MITAKLFIGVDVDCQEALEFAGLKSLAAFEFAINPPHGPAQGLRVQTLGHITKGVVADRTRVTGPALPLRQSGLLFQLQETGDAHHFAQDQAQPDGAARNLRLRPRIRPAPRQQRQIEALGGKMNELAQLRKLRAIHRRGPPPGAAVRR